MTAFRDVLLEVWREVGRHLEIDESTVTITEMLARHLPLDLLLVRRFHLANSSLETVAWGSHEKEFHGGDSRSEISPTRLKRLMAWAGSGKVLRNRSGRPTGEIATLAGENLEGDILAGPLVGRDGPIGTLVIRARQGATFVEEHIAMLEELLEPFSAALGNDLRLHELATLRETAEAEKRSLLTRLGRRDSGETIVGFDAGLQPVMERVELVSRSDVPVLILGETGTGKEVVSRAIHTRSRRSAAPFIRVNCGAIPTELIDSQLFGHERGSFTGAGDMRKGWFERADGGTLFLDEIGELPLPAQVRLLRVLQDGFIERVGGEHPIRIDVRIVAATHRDLPDMVKKGTFREDLWYRVAVFPILLPPLRERREDIPALARHFAERASNRFGLSFVPPSGENLASLTLYDWPGNIREFGAVIDRAAILGEGRSLEISKALGGNATGVANANPATPASAPVPPPGESIALDDFPTLDQAMLKHIQKALIATRGRIEGPVGAAKVLGINPHTLRARMRKHRLQWSEFREPRFDT